MEMDLTQEFPVGECCEIEVRCSCDIVCRAKVKTHVNKVKQTRYEEMKSLGKVVCDKFRVRVVDESLTQPLSGRDAEQDRTGQDGS